MNGGQNRATTTIDQLNGKEHWTGTHWIHHLLEVVGGVHKTPCNKLVSVSLSLPGVFSYAVLSWWCVYVRCTTNITLWVVALIHPLLQQHRWHDG